MAYPGYGAPPTGGYGPPPTAGYPGAPPAGYGAPPTAGYPGAPPSGYPGAPPAGYPGAPPAGYPGAPPAGYPGAAPGPGQSPIDPQVQQWFMAVDSDRSGQISAQELQQALVNGNWSHFNPEVCRLMISMFDRDFSGTINLFEFQALWQYIQQWKGTFERFDSNRTGSIEGQELQQAFGSMGFNVSPQFVQTCVVKFDVYARRSLTLDNFIHACVMLKCLTDAFRQRDTAMTGSVRMSYEDFMTMAVLNKA